MLAFHAKFRRQIELLALAIDNPHRMRPIDLSLEYGCEELTIKRDLGELRSHGFDLHSERGRGLHLAVPPPPGDLRWLVTQYIALAGMDGRADRATALLVRSLKDRALINVVRIQRSIDRRTAVHALYRKTGTAERPVDLEPLHIFQSDAQWRVLARNDGILKQYLLAKMTRVEETTRAFTRPPQEEIDALLRHSFRSWIGREVYRVRISFDRRHAAWVRGRQFTETQEITDGRNGALVLDATVNSLEEIAGWIAGLGAGVRVLEPKALRDRVVALARATLANYSRA
jgi:predicted DNA-binding transcriptional regulator YafY